MPRHHQSDRPRIREAARQHVDSHRHRRRRMTPAEIAARKAERQERKRETPSTLVERRIAREQPAISEPRPRTVSRQNEVARVISLPGRLDPVSWQLPNDLSYEDWRHYGKMLTQMHGAIQWALGDWLSSWRAQIWQAETGAQGRRFWHLCDPNFEELRLGCEAR